MKDDGKNIIEAYLAELTAAGRRTHNPAYALRLFFRFCEQRGYEYRSLSVADAAAFQTELLNGGGHDDSGRLTTGTVFGIVSCLVPLYDYLKKQGLSARNPFRGIDRVKRARSLPRNILNEAGMHRFLTRLKDFNTEKTLTARRQLYRAHVISEFLYATGARISEAAKLTCADIDFSRGVVRITDSKTGRVRDCVMNSFAENVLKIYIEKARGSVLTGKSDRLRLFGAGGSLQTWLNAILNDVSARLKLGRCTSHNFRHAVGYHLLRAGCDIRYIQEILGHRALSSTQVYTKVDKHDLRGVLDRFHPRRREDTDAG